MFSDVSFIVLLAFPVGVVYGYLWSFMDVYGLSKTDIYTSCFVELLHLEHLHICTRACYDYLIKLLLVVIICELTVMF